MLPSPDRQSRILRGAGGTTRSGLLDIVRLFAGFDIIAYHAGSVLGDRNAFRIGVGMGIFLLMNAVSVGIFQGPRPFQPLLRERAVRYLRPFLFWCVVYALLQVFFAIRHDQPPFGWVRPAMAWRGTYYHLWYMPAALGLALLVELLRRGTLRLSTPTIAIGVLLASPALLYAAPGWLEPIGDPSWWPWVWIIPAVPMGVALGRVLALPRTPRWPLLLLGYVGVFAAVGIGLWLHMGETYPLRYAIGAGLIGAGFVAPLPSTPLLMRLRTLSAGIFLVHPLVLRVLLRWLEDLPVAAVAALVWGISAVLAIALQASPLARFVGEPAGPRRRPRPQPRPGVEVPAASAVAEMPTRRAS